MTTPTSGRFRRGGWHRSWRVVVAAAVMLSVAGCQSGPSDGAAPAANPSPAQEPAVAFTNPVYNSNFADPMIIEYPGGGYVAVATNGDGGNVQTLISPDLTSWEPGDDALPELPKWSAPGKVWAPEIARREDGRYVLYYTTRSPNPNVQCVGAAVGTTPKGPFVDSSDKPLVCQPDQGGSIDASPFTAADGTRYLYWKNDGNALGLDTWIWGQRLDATGTKLQGEPKKLFQQDLDWEGTLVEAPFGWEADGRFHLLYSANDFGSESYAVGDAVATDPLGPFTKAGDPLLVTNAVAAGPGHCSLIAKDGKVWMVYHAWAPDAVGSDVPGRTMWLSEVTFGPDGTVQVVPPTVDYPTKP